MGSAGRTASRAWSSARRATSSTPWARTTGASLLLPGSARCCPSPLIRSSLTRDTPSARRIHTHSPLNLAHALPFTYSAPTLQSTFYSRLALSPCGSYIASGSGRGDVHVWEVRGGLADSPTGGREREGVRLEFQGKAVRGGAGVLGAKKMEVGSVSWGACGVRSTLSPSPLIIFSPTVLTFHAPVPHSSPRARTTCRSVSGSPTSTPPSTCATTRPAHAGLGPGARTARPLRSRSPASSRPAYAPARRMALFLRPARNRRST